MPSYLSYLLNCLRQLLRCNLLKSLLLLLVLWLAGCARLTVTGSLPAGVQVERSVAVATGSPFAWHPDAERVALVRDGLRLWTPATGAIVPFFAGAPAALAWSPDGERLVAAFTGEGEARLRLFDPDGQLLGDAAVPGQVGALAWTPDGEILASAVLLKGYTFGGDLTLTLYRWDGRGAPQSTLLHGVTLKPLTLRQWGGMLQRTAAFSLSPVGDEILYARVHDPPAFSPYLKLVLRHLATGNEREVAAVPLTAGGGVFTADGETVLYGDERAVQAVETWTGKKTRSWPTPGRSLAVSVSERWLLLDGRLYRDGAETAVFATDGAASFAPTGGRLLLRDGERLHLVTGLSEGAPAPLTPALRERLLLLRKWRASALISHDEYLELKSRIIP